MATKSFIQPIHKPRFQTNRPLDFLYDPTYTVTDAKEYYKTVQESMRQSSEYAVQPNYSSMFSDVARYPRVTLLLRSANPIPDDVDPSFRGKIRAMECTPHPKANVKGQDRFKFFRKPLVQIPSVPPPHKTALEYQLFSTDFDDTTPPPKETKHKFETGSSQKKYDSSCSQTDYRESETQTAPWAPPYIVTGTITPEILTLTNLAWGQGLPAGVHEVEIIERARMKRAWEKLFPNLNAPEDAEKKFRCMEDIEKDEWVFRVAEIQMIHSLRMELAEKRMRKKQDSHRDKYQDRIERITKTKQTEVKHKLAKAQEQKERELRKLYVLHKGIKKRQSKRNVLDEILDPASQLHGPMSIYGDLSRNRHENIILNKDILNDYEALNFLEQSRTTEKMPFDYNRLSKPKTYFEMCPKIMNWTEEKMERLQEDIKQMHMGGQQKKRVPLLIERLPPVKKEPTTPSISHPSISETDLISSVTFIEKVMRGRACQALMFEEREKFKYLIEELKSTHALEDIELKKLTEIRYNSLKRKRKNLVQERMEAKKKQLVSLFSGEIASDLLVFLAKEQERLHDEQRIHAFAMLAERERWRREAAESGRRQREDIFRQKQDNSFKQVMKIRQETIDIYLEDVIIKSMGSLATENARDYVRQIARQVDLAACEAEKRKDVIEQEEMVSHLLHNFLVPEAHKEMVRRTLEARQRKYLDIAHNIVHNKLFTSDPAQALILSHHNINKLELKTSTPTFIKEKESDLTTVSSLRTTECVDKTSEEEIAFAERADEFYWMRQEELRTESKEFPHMTRPLKELAHGSIAFTREVISKAEEKAEKKQHEIRIQKLKIELQDTVDDILGKASAFVEAEEKAKKKQRQIRIRQLKQELKDTVDKIMDEAGAIVKSRKNV